MSLNVSSTPPSGRMEQLLTEAGASAEAVRAVLGERGDDPALAASTAEELRRELQQAAAGGEGARLKAAMQVGGRGGSLGARF